MIADAWRVSLALGSLHDDAYCLVVEVRGALYPLTYSRPTSRASRRLAGGVGHGWVRKPL